eukprot:1136240-Pelagomonas_calceolata.AAC.16
MQDEAPAPIKGRFVGVKSSIRAAQQRPNRALSSHLGPPCHLAGPYSPDRSQTFCGPQVRCHYFLRVNIAGKGMTPDTKHDSPIWVRNVEQPSEAAAPIKVRDVVILHVVILHVAILHVAILHVAILHVVILHVAILHVVMLQKRLQCGAAHRGGSAHQRWEAFTLEELVRAASWAW